MSGASSASAMPYIGSKISLITNSELRYEGTLVNINTSNSTVTLRDVRMSGTENRRAPHFVMPSPEIFDYIVFNGKDIKDLTVSEPGFSVKEDPAVVAVNVAPPALAGHSMHHGGHHQMGGHPNGPSAVQHGPHGGGMMGPGQGRMGGRMNSQGGNYNGRGGHASGYGSPVGGRGYGGMRRMDGGYHHGDGGPVGNRKMASKQVVGELSAQPNNSLKTQVAATFDFEESNSKFVKGAGLEDAAEALPSAPVYDKNQSFFDNISCETLNRQHGRDSKIDRERQRELDTETFGSAAAVARGPRYYRRGYRRGGMRGSRGMYNGPQGQGQVGSMMMGRGGMGGVSYSAYQPQGVVPSYARYGKHVKAQ